MSLMTVEDALKAMLSRVAALAAEDVPLDQADGRWLATDVVARRDQPPFDASAMDGWAVRRADIDADMSLKIVGEGAAGRGYGHPLGPGETVRIFTGAPLPAGADHVVIQEQAEQDGDQLRPHPAADALSWVRPRGCDFMRGQVLLRAGQRLNPWRLALAAASGLGVLSCTVRPRVALLTTGDEIVAPGQTAGPDQIFDSAGPALAAITRRNGGVSMDLKTAADTLKAIMDAASSAAFDILVTIGGASVGDHDLVKPALRALGAELCVEGAAMRPGRPVWFARLPDGRAVLGLPGNPASALVCAELFLVPLLARLQGALDPRHAFEMAALEDDLPANGPRDHYLRALASTGPDGQRRVRAFPDQDSSLVNVMAAADILIRRPPHAPAALQGTLVRTLVPTR